MDGNYVTSTSSSSSSSGSSSSCSSSSSSGRSSSSSNPPTKYMKTNLLYTITFNNTHIVDMQLVSGCQEKVCANRTGYSEMLLGILQNMFNPSLDPTRPDGSELLTFSYGGQCIPRVL